MKCSTFRKISMKKSDLTDLCRAHMESCPACRSEVEAAQALQKLLALKKYERIPEDSLAAAKLAFHEFIDKQNSRENTIWGVHPVLRFALAGSFLVLIILNISTSYKLPPITSHLQLAATEIVTAEPVRRPVMTHGPYLASSNSEPAAIQYGPLPSRLVNFNY